MFPEQNKIELFAREVPEGWDVHGNEVEANVFLGEEECRKTAQRERATWWDKASCAMSQRYYHFLITREQFLKLKKTTAS